MQGPGSSLTTKVTGVTSRCSSEALPFSLAWKHSLESSGAGDAQDGQKRGLVELPATPAPHSFLPPFYYSPSMLIRAELSFWV